jgi:predicted esterase
MNTSLYDFVLYKLGLYRFIDDGINILLLVILYIVKPSLGKEFVTAWFKTKRVQYAQDSLYHKLDILELQEGSQDLPILVFVHGGSWGAGRLLMYLLTTKRMAELIGASHAIVLGYPVYPVGSIEDQTLAIKKGLEYIRNQSQFARLFNTATHRPPPLVLAGHSSGAHIALLTIMRTVMGNEPCPCDCFLGLSGIYDLVTHYSYKKVTGGINGFYSLLLAANGLDQLPVFSPYLLMKEFLANKKAHPSQFYRELPYIGLIHGITDSMVPQYETNNLLETLKSFEFPRCKGVLIQVNLCPEYVKLILFQQ